MRVLPFYSDTGEVLYFLDEDTGRRYAPSVVADIRSGRRTDARSIVAPPYDRSQIIQYLGAVVGLCVAFGLFLWIGQSIIM